MWRYIALKRAGLIYKLLFLLKRLQTVQWKTYTKWLSHACKIKEGSLWTPCNPGQRSSSNSGMRP